MLKTQTRQLKDLIAKDRLDKVIDDLLLYTQSLADDRYHDDMIRLSARWKANERGRMLRTLSADQYNVEKNIISDALLALIGELGAANNAETNGSANPAPTGKVDFWKKVGYAGLILGILASMVKIIEFCNKPSAANGEAMQLTVYVQGTDGKPVAEIQNSGKIIVDFGNDRRAPLIGENGRTNLGEIPEKFRGEKIPIVLQADGYEPADASRHYIMDGKPVYFLIRRDNSLGRIQGIVKDRSGEKFIAGALVMIDQDSTTTTDSLGRFHLLMPPDKHKDTYTLTVKKDGYKVKNEYYKPKSGSIEIRLER